MKWERWFAEFLSVAGFATVFWLLFHCRVVGQALDRWDRASRQGAPNARAPGEPSYIIPLMVFLLIFAVFFVSLALLVLKEELLHVIWNSFKRSMAHAFLK